jgi:hypothetical protein
MPHPSSAPHAQSHMPTQRLAGGRTSEQAGVRTLPDAAIRTGCAIEGMMRAILRVCRLAHGRCSSSSSHSSIVVLIASSSRPAAIARRRPAA